MNSIVQYEHPYVCTDATVFTIKTSASDSYRKLPTLKLCLLLYQRTEDPFKGQWCLPGGFLNIDELPEENISRKLTQKAGVESCYLEQLYTFCNVSRDPRARVISITYLGLMKESESLRISDDQWFELTPEGVLVNLKNTALQLTEKDLGFDHYHIITKSVERLKSKLQYTDLAFHLLPECFTLTHAQNVYETILSKKDTAANFRRKVAPFVQETDQYTTDMGHRPAKLFVKNQQLYEEDTL